MKKIKISIIGLGFVGLTLAAVNANLGYKTTGIEIDKEKLDKIKNGKPDFYEPDVEKLLKNSLKKKTISFTNKFESILDTDITFVTVGTPSDKNGKIDLKKLKKAIFQLSNILKKKKSQHVVVIKSTVIPTTTSKIILPIFKKNSNVIINVNPEFLREGRAIHDLKYPHLIVIGSKQKNEHKILKEYYKQFYQKLPEIIETDCTTAEMIKYSNNIFLATKISFINSIANICQKLPSVDINQIAHAIGKDPRIGEQFLQAGPGFGGSCLPKDLSAMINFSKKIGNPNQLLEAVEKINKSQPEQILQILKDLKIKNKKIIISILGLSFKKDTDDIRESVSITLVNNLLKKNFKINVHDPMAIENFEKIYKNKINYYEKISECIKDSDCCIILTDWKEYTELKPRIFSKNMRTKNIIDARRVLDPRKFNELNYRAIGLG
jgi:UDPglucose 6-dehydrogenase